jgi:hypothetical protein
MTLDEIAISAVYEDEAELVIVRPRSVEEGPVVAGAL